MYRRQIGGPFGYTKIYPVRIILVYVGEMRVRSRSSPLRELYPSNTISFFLAPIFYDISNRNR